MTSEIRFRGVFAFAVTPTKEDGEAVDLSRLRHLLDYLLEAGVHGVAVFGSTGAVGSFTEEERRQVAEATVRHIAGRVSVVIGTGAISTSEAVRLSLHAQEIGADAVLVVPVTYWIPTEAELFGHYEAIAQAVKIPLCIYNSPRLANVDMSPAFIARLAGALGVSVMKESSDDLTRITAVARLTEDRMTVLTGCDPTAIEGFLLGARGWCSGISNITPRPCVQLYELAEKGDFAEARRLQQRLFPLCDFAFGKGLIRTCHTALELLGRPVGPPRRPIRMLGGADRERLRELLCELELPAL